MSVCVCVFEGVREEMLLFSGNRDGLKRGWGGTNKVCDPVCPLRLPPPSPNQAEAVLSARQPGLCCRLNGG